MAINETQLPIIVNNWTDGIGLSGITGFQEMRNVDVWNRQGIAKSGYVLKNAVDNSLSLTFTVNTTTEIVTFSASINRTNGFSGTARAVTFSTTGTLPAPLATGTVYYLYVDSGYANNEARVAPTLTDALNGTNLINFTTTGSGTHTMTTVNMGEIRSFTFDPRSTQQYFAQDNNGRIWLTNTSGSLWLLLTGNTLPSTGQGGQGIIVWKNYLFVFRQGAIDVYGSLASSTPTWTNSWQTTNLFVSNNPTVQPIVAQDDVIYFANRNTGIFQSIPYLGAIIEAASSTFDPANAATYTFAPLNLALPDYKFITAISELRDLIVIGTVDREIYLYDGASDNFEYPIIASEDNIRAMVTINNTLYYSCGSRGNIYRTLGTTSELIIDFSDQMSRVPEWQFFVTHMANYQGRLLFLGRSVPTSATTGISGVYLYNIESNTYILSNRFSSGYEGTPTALFTNFPDSNIEMFISSRTNAGVVSLDVLAALGVQRPADTLATITSQSFRVGYGANPRTLERVDITLSKRLVSGQSIVITLIDDDDSTNTSTLTFDTTTMIGGYGTLPANLQKLNSFRMVIQINTGITPQAGTTNYTTPELWEVRVY